jgi:hypothetical protein
LSLEDDCMLKIKRLNLDTSWHIEWNGTSLLLDPWLVGSEVDYFPAFNKQWHKTPPTKIEQLDPYDAILISQHFSDHCHEETLKLLKKENLLCTPKALQRIKKTFTNLEIQTIPSFSENKWLKFKDLEISWLPAPKKMSASFSGIIIRNENDCIVYCPHSYDLLDSHLRQLEKLNTVLLITSFSTFKLPFFLGGYVNPGMKQAQQLIAKTNPNFIMATHDENKYASGIVKKIAKVNYPNSDELALHFSSKFIDANNINHTFELQINALS